MKPLGDFPLFNGVDEMILAKLQRSCSMHEFGIGTNIVSRGNTCKGIWFVFGGQARKIVYTENGTAVEFGAVKARQHFGEECFGGSWPYDVVTELQTLCIHMPKATVVIAMGIPQIAERLLTKVALVVSDGVRRIYEVKELSAPARARQELMRRLQQGETFTHDEIAWTALTTRETVARVAGEMKRSKMIARSGKLCNGGAIYRVLRHAI